MSRSLTAVLVVLLASGCSAQPEPDVGAGVTPSAGSGTPIIDDPPGSLTCGALLAAVTAATLMTPGVVDVIARASSTADAPVAESAQRPAAAYAGAVAAHGTGNEPDAVAAVSAAGDEMSRVCDDSALDTVG